MVRIRRQYVRGHDRTYSGTSSRTSITIHETANRSRGADAAAHANLQSGGNSRAASWHYQVDDKEAVQSWPHSARCWHAGYLARNSIAIEICVNADGDYNKALQNAAELVAHIRREEPSVKRVVQHHLWTWKNCPTILRQRGWWKKFLRMCRGADGGASRGGGRPATKPNGDLVVDGKWGSGTTRKLQKVLDAPFVDGEISRQNRRWKRSNPGLTTGWQWFRSRRKYRRGSQTIRLMQQRLGVKADGLIGPNTIKALQRHLDRVGAYDGARDGEIWKPSSTVRALQRRLNGGKF